MPLMARADLDVIACVVPAAAQVDADVAAVARRRIATPRDAVVVGQRAAALRLFMNL